MDILTKCIESAWQRPTLTGGNPQLLSALKSLTAVFGMGTGVSFSLSPPHNFFYNLRRYSASVSVSFAPLLMHTSALWGLLSYILD